MTPTQKPPTALAAQAATYRKILTEVIDFAASNPDAPASAIVGYLRGATEAMEALAAREQGEVE